MKRNRRHVEAVLGPRLVIAPDVPPTLASLMFEAETSGGLLFSIEPERAGQVLPEFAAGGEECWEIGRVIAEPGIRIVR